MLSIQELTLQYLSYARNVRGFSPATLKSRVVYLRQFTAFVDSVSDGDITQITNRDLDNFFVTMSERVSIGTVNTSKQIVRVFLKWCKDYLDIELTLKTTEIRENKKPDRQPIILEHKTIRMVISRTSHKQDRLIMSVMYEAGLRINEVADMKIEHIRGNTIHVIGKGGKHRICYVTPKLSKELHSWMGENGWTEGYIFRPIMHGRGDSGYSHTDTIRQRIKHHFQRIAGVEMHPHLLRHAFALRLLKKGCNVRIIQKLLGHTRLETTMVYLDISNDYLEAQYKMHFGASVFA